MFRSDQNATLQQYRNKLETSLNASKSMPQAVELSRQQDILAGLSSQLQEAVAQRDVAQRQLSAKCSAGVLGD